MKIFSVLLTLCFAFNASALSFTERMSMQNKTGVATQTEQKSTLTEEDKALVETECKEVEDFSQLVQALLIIIALMATVIYFQNKKITKLSEE